MNEVCSKDSINWLKYDNYRNINKTHKSEERIKIFTLFLLIHLIFNLEVDLLLINDVYGIIINIINYLKLYKYNYFV